MTFTNFKRAFLTLSILAVSIYGVETFASEDHSKMDHSKMNHGEKMKMNKSNRKALDIKTKKEIVKALKANEDVHNAFFEYDAKKVEKTSSILNKAIQAISNPEVSKLLKFSQSKIADIKATNDRDDNNQNYHLASMALIHIVNTYDVGNEYNAYSCPMVKKKWLQNSKKMSKVHNPYAPNMPHCGGQDTSH
jgi:hypothetical protein